MILFLLFLGLNCLPSPHLPLEGWLSPSVCTLTQGMRVGRAQLELSAVFAGGPGSRVTNHPGVAGTFPDEALKVPPPGKHSPSRHQNGGSPYLDLLSFLQIFKCLRPLPTQRSHSWFSLKQLCSVSCNVSVPGTWGSTDSSLEDFFSLSDFQFQFGFSPNESI